MIERAVLGLSSAEKTAFAGESLAQTLYGVEALYITGDVGAGKTTFLQGLGRALGIPEPVLSPTFALAHPYAGADGHTLVTHIDLYRLQPDQAEHFFQQLQWDGLLWAEWADRLERKDWRGKYLHVDLRDAGAGRDLTIDFEDIPLPSSEQILEWRRQVGTPPNVIAHCETVGHVAKRLAEMLLQRGTVVRPRLAEIGGRLHDLFRFLDFRPDGRELPEFEAVWKPWKERFTGLRHERAVAEFLIGEGYPELAEVVRYHGLLPKDPSHVLTTEQKIVFYADKRAIGSKVASSAERFADFDVRYGQTSEIRLWIDQTLAMEKNLFPEGVPETADLIRETARDA